MVRFKILPMTMVLPLVFAFLLDLFFFTFIRLFKKKTNVLGKP